MGDDGMIHHWPEVDPARTTGWSRDCEIDSTDVRMKKIRSAFDNVKSFPLKRIVIQFWAPGKYSGKQQVLLCYSFPYALSHLNRRLWKYRSGCCKYYYTFEDHQGTIPMTITSGPHCNAATTGFPEVVVDLTVHRGTPLVDLALECELTCFMLLPVFDENQCCGVIEVSMRQPSDLLVIFNELYREIQRVGLSLYPRRTRSLPALTGDLGSARSEIRNALQVAIQSHAITLGIVRVSYWNYIASPSMKRTLLRKSADSYFGNAVADDHLCLELFSSNLTALLKTKGEGLVARTLETNRPHLCRNIYKLSENKGLVTLLLSTNAKSYAWFVIGLRSSHTGELDYVFEFFWPQSHNHVALMEDLLLTLRERLPSFKYASGAQLGHEALVVDFENNSSSSSGSASEKTIKIFPRNTKSQEPKVTRASYDLHGDDQRALNQYPKDDLVILAFHKVHQRLFFLPSSATFENVMDTIKQEFGRELNPAGTYRVDYQVLPGKWYRLTDDTCLRNCISSYRASNDIDYIKLYVLLVEE